MAKDQNRDPEMAYLIEDNQVSERPPSAKSIWCSTSLKEQIPNDLQRKMVVNSSMSPEIARKKNPNLFTDKNVTAENDYYASKILPEITQNSSNHTDEGHVNDQHNHITENSDSQSMLKEPFPTKQGKTLINNHPISLEATPEKKDYLQNNTSTRSSHSLLAIPDTNKLDNDSHSSSMPDLPNDNSMSYDSGMNSSKNIVKNQTNDRYKLKRPTVENLKHRSPLSEDLKSTYRKSRSQLATNKIKSPEMGIKKSHHVSSSNLTKLVTSATKDHVNDHHPDTFSPQSQVQDVDSPITKQEYHQVCAQNSHGDQTETTNITGDKTCNLDSQLEQICLKGITGEWSITLDDIKDIILSQTVPCDMLNSFIIGLPFAGSSKLLQEFFKAALITHPQLPHHETYQNNEEGLSSYEVSVLQCHDGSTDKLMWFGHSDCLKDLLTCGAKILYENFLRRQKIMMRDQSNLTIFTNEALNNQIYSVHQNISNHINNLKIPLKCVIASGASFMNNVNIGLKKGILEVLNIISQHIKVNLGLIVLQIEDVERLGDTPHFSQTNSTVIQQDTKLLCLVEYIRLLKLASCQNFITFVITCGKETSQKDKEEARNTLCRLLEGETKKLSLSKASVLVIDETSKEDLKELKATFDKAIKRQCTTRSNVKLSWLFLHRAIISSKQVVMSYGDLKSVAAELNIGQDEYNDCLQTFTSSMTVLHLPEFLKEFVILQPVEFINALSLFFQKPVHVAQFNGVYTMEQVHEIVPNKSLAKAIMNTLCSLGLATMTNENKVNRKISPLSASPPKLLFVPLAKSASLSKDSYIINSLHIIFNSQFVPLDSQGFFTSFLLELENVSLENSYEINIIKFLITTRRDHYFLLVFQPTHIEAYLEYNNELDGMFGEVLHCCIQSMEKVCKITKDFTYFLALLCRTPGQHYGSKYGNLIKELLVDANSQLCHHCEAQLGPTRKKWKEITCKVLDDIKKEKDRISAENLFTLARDLRTVVRTTQSLRSLAIQLGVPTRDRQLYNFISRYQPWQRSLILLWTWEQRVGTANASREELKKALHRLGHASGILK